MVADWYVKSHTWVSYKYPMERWMERWMDGVGRGSVECLFMLQGERHPSLPYDVIPYCIVLYCIILWIWVGRFYVDSTYPILFYPTRLISPFFSLFFWVWFFYFSCPPASTSLHPFPPPLKKPTNQLTNQTESTTHHLLSSPSYKDIPPSTVSQPLI